MVDPDKHISPKHFPRNPEFKGLSRRPDEAPGGVREDEQHVKQALSTGNRAYDYSHSVNTRNAELAVKWRLLESIRFWTYRLVSIFHRSSE